MQPTPPTQQSSPPIPVDLGSTLEAKLSRFTTTAPKATVLRRSGRFTVGLRSTQAALGTLTLSGKSGSASIAKAGDLVLATKGAQLSSGKARTVRLVIPKRLRKGLRRGRELTLTVQLVDGGGNRTMKTRTVKLR